MKMNTRQKHWFFFIATAIGAIVIVNLAILLMWTDMNEEERIFGRQIFGRVITYGTLAMIVLFFISSQFILYIFRNYISPIETLTEETRLIAAANAKYRIKPVGAMETHNLTSVINDLADSYISLKSDVKNIVTESKEGFDEEKQRLQALMNLVTEGILICNNDGRILSCNHQAYQIFNSIEHNEIGRFSRLGVGRSIFNIFNKTPITYAFEEVFNKAKKQDNTPYNFITTRYKKQYLDVKIAPVLKNNNSNSISGFVITFNDITNQINTNQTEQYGEQQIILDEIASIANMKTNNEFNFITENGIWLSIQHHYISNLLIEIANYLKTLNVKTISIGVSNNNNLQINWSGNEANFKSEQSNFNDLILSQNSINSHSKIELNINVYKQQSEIVINNKVASRPVFYNTDIFKETTRNETLKNKALRDLTYIVFDTETTGLNPSGGDEIISIAGVRVHKMKLNDNEIFDELVNPQRSIPLTSLKIHEIYPEMLDNKLTINKVLPMFHEFCQNAVLVAHNAAFDMKFIELKKEQTGIKFNNPVIDTLLLAAVCHPKQELHNLEDIAEKYDIEIIGRHTALGDALVTAEVLLKLIPILESMGIKTLKEAQEATSKTYYSNIKF